MAALPPQNNGSTAPAAPLDKTRMFKGHPQPPIEERLIASKIFLADEDINGCLDFTTKLAEVEEYLNYIEKEKLPHNKYLFQDVRSMVEAHKDWIGRMDKPPRDHDGPNVPSIQNYSTRLIDTNTASHLQNERRLLGLETQMREDHPPFTLDRSDDQTEFLQKMKRDACANPAELDPETNLFSRETGAYNWALREPSIIPYWMHWKKGLPNKGVIPAGALPSNAAATQSREIISTSAPGPPGTQLQRVIPEYLQQREKILNQLVRNPGLTDKGLEELVSFLILHAPLEVRQIRDEWKYFDSIKDCLTAEEIKKLSQLETTFGEKFRAWVNTFYTTGIQIKLSQIGEKEPDAPGVFYFKDAQPTPGDSSQLREWEDRINIYLNSKSLPGREDQLRRDLNQCLPESIKSIDTRAHAFLIRALKLSHTKYFTLSAAERSEFGRTKLESLTDADRTSYLAIQEQRSQAFGSWLATLQGTKIALKYLLPGEIAAAGIPSYLYIPWNPPTEAPLQQPSPEAREFESSINDLLYSAQSSKLHGKSADDLDTKLDSVLYQKLRKVKAACSEIERTQMSDTITTEQAITSHDRFQFRFDLEYTSWKECLVWRNVQIKVAQKGVPEFNPEVLYYRGHYKGIEPSPPTPKQSFQQWENALNKLLKEYNVPRPDDPFSSQEAALYPIIAHLQYPVLKRLDVSWRALSGESSTTSSTTLRFKTKWERSFRTWLNMLSKQEGPIVIKEAYHKDEDLGDPGVVYHQERPDDSTDGQLLPRTIQLQINRIHVLLESFALNPRQEAQVEIGEHLGPFWRPARQYQDHLNFVESHPVSNEDAQKDELWRQEFETRRALFIHLSALNGFRVEKHGSRGFEALDPTATLPHDWRIPGSGRASETDPEYFKKLLRCLWVYPKRFYRALHDLEVEINEIFGALRLNGPSTPEESAKLLQLLQPFLPRSLREFWRQLKSPSTKNGTSGSTNNSQKLVSTQKHFIALFGQWVRKLQRYAATKWVKILLKDRTELSSGSFFEFDGRLYFPKPDVKKGDYINTDMTPSDDFPLRFQRYQDEINDLLEIRQSGIQWPGQTRLSWEENDRLRQLLRLVMDPIMAKTDDELRARDATSRKKLLKGEKLATFLSKSESWYSNYNQWVDSLPRGGIVLRILSTEALLPTSNPAIRFIHFNCDKPLRRFQSRSVPLHVWQLNRELNAALYAYDLSPKEQEAVYARFSPLVTASFRQDVNQIKEYALLTKLPSKFFKDVNETPTPEKVAIVQCVEEFAHRFIWERLKRAAILNRETGISVEVFESLRGELRIRVVRGGPQTDEGGKTNASPGDWPFDTPLLKLAIVAKASKEYLTLATRVQNGEVITERERTRVMRLLTASPEDDEQEEGMVIASVLRLSKGQNLTAEEENQANEVILRHLWYQFSKLSPDRMHRAFPKLRSIENTSRVLDQISLATPRKSLRLAPVPTNEEVWELGVEVNNLLVKARDGTIAVRENQILDYLLHPLGTDRLRELDRLTWYLHSKHKLGRSATATPQDNVFTPSQSLLLIELQSQLREEFHDWKTNLPRHGLIFDGWFSEPDALTNTLKRFRKIKDTFGSDTLVFGSTNSELQDPLVHEYMEKFLLLERYVTDSSFLDTEEKLMLGRFPADLSELRDGLLDFRSSLGAQGQGLDLGKNLTLNLSEHKFVSRYLDWYCSFLPSGVKSHNIGAVVEPDFSGKAERRGARRAAIEMALNLLATNKEQHRPLDKFRKVEMPREYQPPLPEVPMWLPIEPHNRPLEQDPFRITKLMLRYRKWKDDDYQVARTRAIEMMPGRLLPPINHNGPFMFPTEHDLYSVARERQKVLIAIQLSLIQAGKLAPRPLVHRLTTLINEGLVLPPNMKSHPLASKDGTEMPLERQDLDILRELTAPSWSEEERPYPNPSLFFEPGTTTQMDMIKLAEFERDVNMIIHEMPLWSPETPPSPRSNDQNAPEFYMQRPYEASEGSTNGWDVDTIVEKVNADRTNRSQKCQPVYMWTRVEAIAFLQAMHEGRRVHFTNGVEGGLASRIPPSGHPENKYVVNTEQMVQSPYIRLNKVECRWEVHCNATKDICTPILRPDFYEYLQNVAYRVGRDIRLLHNDISSEHTGAEKLHHQTRVMELTRNVMDKITTNEHGIILPFQTETHQRDGKQPEGKEVSLRKIARDLVRVAPDLVDEAQVSPEGDPITKSEKDPAPLIQMQLIEESNNNWEPRFPENEHVWDFAAPRVRRCPAILPKSSPRFRHQVTQYFDVRRWPLWCQSEETQARIRASGPTVQEKPAPTETEVDEDMQLDLREDSNGERHYGRGGPPMFPFGETPYQQAYQGWLMEEDLKDVEEFKPKPAPRRSILFSRKPKEVEEPPVDRYALPEIPAGWKPDSVSMGEKRRDVTERLRNSDGFPENQAYYYNQRELEYIKARDELALAQSLRAETKAMVERHTGKPYDKLKMNELRAVQDELQIDPISDIAGSLSRQLPPDVLMRERAGLSPFRGGRQGRKAIQPAMRGAVPILPPHPEWRPEKRKGVAMPTGLSPILKRVRS